MGGSCGSVREVVETCRALLLKGETRDVAIALESVLG